MVQALPFIINACRGTQHTAVETIPVKFLQQDEPCQVFGWRVETTAVQIIKKNMLHGNALYVTCEETCFNVTAYEWVGMAELQSTQEEGYTRLLLHALHAARTGSQAVIVTSEDTVVMLLCLAFQKDTPCPIYQKCGTRFVEISKLAWSLGNSICDHHAQIVSSCTYFEPSTRQQTGSAVTFIIISPLTYIDLPIYFNFFNIVCYIITQHSPKILEWANNTLQRYTNFINTRVKHFWSAC